MEIGKSKAEFEMEIGSFRECRNFSSFRNLVRIALLLFAFAGFVTNSAGAQNTESQSKSGVIRNAAIGIEGFFRIGLWTVVEVEFDQGGLPEEFQLVVKGPDDEGSEVSFVKTYRKKDLVGNRAQQLVKIGRLQSRVTVEVQDSSGKVLAQSEPVDTSKALPSQTELVVAVGKEVGWDRLFEDRNRSLGKGTTKYIRVDQFAKLPIEPLAYEAIDLVYVNTRDLGTTETEKENIAGLIRGIELGCRLAITAGEDAEEFIGPNRPLASIVPGEYTEVAAINSSSGLEAFLSANQRLLQKREDRLTVAKLKSYRGALLAYEGTGQNQVPLLIKGSVGFGQVLFLAFDIDKEPVQSWRSKDRLLLQLASISGLEEPKAVRDAGSRKITHIGYEDLSGQLRAALDQFPEVQIVTFTSVAAIVVLFLLLIGPVDYYFLKFVVKKMEWTWVTSSLLIALFSIGIAIWFYQAKGTERRLKKVELVDVDVATNRVRGTSWANFYSPTSGEFGIDARAAEWTENSSPIAAWQGLPGKGLRGMEATLLATSRARGYEVELNSSESRKSLERLPVYVASSRPLQVTWTGTSTLTIPETKLVADKRNNTLSGDWQNPFPFDLERVTIFYRTWAYVSETEVKANETLSVIGQTQERTREAFLTGRRVDRANDKGERWDTQGVNVSRLIEAISFYETIGAKDYFALNNRMFKNLDWSHHLDRNVALVLAKTDKETLQTDISLGDNRDLNNDSETYIRILVPVIER